MSNVNLTDVATIAVTTSTTGTASISLTANSIAAGLSYHVISVYASNAQTTPNNVYCDVGNKRIINLDLPGSPAPGANLISKDNMVSLTGDGPTSFSCGGDSFVTKTVTYITLHEYGVGSTPTSYLPGNGRNLRSSYIAARSMATAGTILVDNPATSNSRTVVQSVLLTNASDNTTYYVYIFQGNNSGGQVPLLTRMPIEPGITLSPIGRNAPVCLLNGYDLRVQVFNAAGTALSGTDVSAYATWLDIGR